MNTHYFENEDGKRIECGDEGGLCPECFALEAAKWARYFGITPTMTRQETLNRLEQFRPASEGER